MRSSVKLTVLVAALLLVMVSTSWIGRARQTAPSVSSPASLQFYVGVKQLSLPNLTAQIVITNATLYSFYISDIHLRAIVSEIKMKDAEGYEYEFYAVQRGVWTTPSFGTNTSPGQLLNPNSVYEKTIRFGDYEIRPRDPEFLGRRKARYEIETRLPLKPVAGRNYDYFPVSGKGEVFIDP